VLSNTPQCYTVATEKGPLLVVHSSVLGCGCLHAVHDVIAQQTAGDCHARVTLESVCSKFEGSSVEDNIYSISVHYRNVSAVLSSYSSTFPSLLSLVESTANPLRVHGALWSH
jgi:hypothetical protein